MNDHIHSDPSRRPIISAVNGEAMADTRDVASYFGKEHKNVLQALRNAHCSEEFRRRNFQPFKIRDLTGESTSHVLMTKNGFAFVVLAFTGEKAARFREEYILAFDAMETELRRQAQAPAFAIPQTLSEALRLAADLADENGRHRAVIEQQGEAIASLQPKATFFDAFANADGLYGLQNAARVLGEPPNKFIGQLKAEFLFYQGGSLVPKAQYRQMGIFEVKATMVDDKARYQSYVTPRGLQYLAKRLGKNHDLYGPGGSTH